MERHDRPDLIEAQRQKIARNSGRTRRRICQPRNAQGRVKTRIRAEEGGNWYDPICQTPTKQHVGERVRLTKASFY